DQYSLALIFAEMLTGMYPRLKGTAGKPGYYRRPGHGDARTNSQRRPDVGPGKSAMRGQVKVDLDLLPAADRPAIARALSDDPSERYPSCVALIEAPRATTVVAPRQPDLFTTLPLVIPFSSLMGEPPPPGIVLPQSSTVVA